MSDAESPRLQLVVLQGSESEYSDGYSADRLLGTSGYWCTKPGAAFPQSVLFGIPGGATIDSVSLRPNDSYTDSNVKDFDLYVGRDVGSLALVGSFAMQNEQSVQSFRFSPTEARLVHFVARTNHGGSYILLARFAATGTGQVPLVTEEPTKSSRPRASAEMIGAARAGDVSAVAAYLEVGVDPNAVDESNTPILSIAAGSGALEVVRRLLDRGADPCPPDGASLCVALSREHFDVASLLAERGARVDHGANGRTALTHILSIGEPPTSAVEWLLARGAPMGADKRGNRPLHRAAREGWVAIVRALLKAGAPVDDGPTDVDTPLAAAERHGHAAVAEVLRAAGATRGSSSPPPSRLLWSDAQVRDRVTALGGGAWQLGAPHEGVVRYRAADGKIAASARCSLVLEFDGPGYRLAYDDAIQTLLGVPIVQRVDDGPARVTNVGPEQAYDRARDIAQQAGADFVHRADGRFFAVSDLASGDRAPPAPPDGPLGDICGRSLERLVHAITATSDSDAERLGRDEFLGMIRVFEFESFRFDDVVARAEATLRTLRANTPALMERGSAPLAVASYLVGCLQGSRDVSGFAQEGKPLNLGASAPIEVAVRLETIAAALEATVPDDAAAIRAIATWHRSIAAAQYAAQKIARRCAARFIREANDVLDVFGADGAAALLEVFDDVAGDLDVVAMYERVLAQARPGHPLALKVKDWLKKLRRRRVVEAPAPAHPPAAATAVTAVTAGAYVEPPRPVDPVAIVALDPGVYLGSRGNWVVRVRIIAKNKSNEQRPLTVEQFRLDGAYIAGPDTTLVNRILEPGDTGEGVLAFVAYETDSRSERPTSAALKWRAADGATWATTFEVPVVDAPIPNAKR
jgi:hypothetical protein